MWNSQKPLELLGFAPVSFDEENLKNIQQIVDVDKYINSMLLWHDLCGAYAPFCKYCDKCGNTPCAVAFVKYKKEEQAQSEVAVTAVNEDNSENKADNKEQEDVNNKNESRKKNVRIAIARKKR